MQLVVLALGKLGMGSGGQGGLYAVWGAGGMLGSVAILVLVRRRGYGLALAIGALSFAAGLALAGLDGVPVAVAAMVPAVLGFALVETAVMALVPRTQSSPSTLRGRVSRRPANEPARGRDHPKPRHYPAATSSFSKSSMESGLIPDSCL